MQIACRMRVVALIEQPKVKNSRDHKKYDRCNEALNMPLQPLLQIENRNQGNQDVAEEKAARLSRNLSD